MRADEDRLTDTQERALIALDEQPAAEGPASTGPEGWHRANLIPCGIVPGERFREPTWHALARFGYVETHESAVRQLEVRITDNGRALLASMGD